MRKVAFGAALVVAAVLSISCSTTNGQEPSTGWSRIPASEFTEFSVIYRPPAPVIRDFPIAIPKKRMAQRMAQPKPVAVVKVTKHKNYPAPKKYALSRIGAVQFSCLNKLWNHESGWRTTAGNPYSGAYGIPQALPGSKMSKYGSDWRTNPITQVKWGLGYVKGRYGSACGAWEFFRLHNWY